MTTARQAVFRALSDRPVSAETILEKVKQVQYLGNTSLSGVVKILESLAKEHLVWVNDRYSYCTTYARRYSN